MNKGGKKLSLALGLIAGLGVLSIAYAALSSTLYIKGDGEVATGQVMFTSCTAEAIGTNDTTVNTDAGAALPGDSNSQNTGASATYSPTDAGALAFGKAADANNMIIGRSSYQSNHDGDTLEIKGTELYDYGSYVIYDVTLKNTAKNSMYLSKVPKIATKFVSTSGNIDVDKSVAVTVHSTLDEAKAYNGTSATTVLTAYTLTSAAPTVSSVKYLLPEGETHWFIKIRRLSQAEGGEALKSGNFEFTVRMTDAQGYEDNSGSDVGTKDVANAAVWEATAHSAT